MSDIDEVIDGGLNLGFPKRVITDEEKRGIIEMLSAGETIMRVRERFGLSATKWIELRRDPSFELEYKNARQHATDELSDKLLTVVFDLEDSNKARVHSENIKWVLSKRNPTTYGDRIDLNITERLNITGALDAANARIAAVRDVNELGLLGVKTNQALTVPIEELVELPDLALNSQDLKPQPE